ncbi:hypothetical protein D3C71_1076560 [compost metagenome]
MQHDVDLGAFQAQDQRRQVHRLGRIGQHFGHGVTQFLRALFLGGRHVGAIRPVFVDDADLDVLGVQAHARGDGVMQRVHHRHAVQRRVGVAAEQVLVAARGDLVGGGAQFEIGHAGQFGHGRGRVRDARGVAAEHAHHVGRDQALGFRHGLRRVHGVRLDEFDLFSVDAARGVDFVDGKLQAAIALLSQKRKRAAEREEGAHFHVGRRGAACQCAAHAQRQNNLVELEHCLRSFVGMGCGLF